MCFRDSAITLYRKRGEAEFSSIVCALGAKAVNILCRRRLVLSGGGPDLGWLYASGLLLAKVATRTGC